MNRRCEQGPTHRGALGVGHQTGTIRKLARLPGMNWRSSVDNPPHYPGFKVEYTMSTHTKLSAEARFLIDFNLHTVAAAVGVAVPDAAAAAIFDVSETQLADYNRDVKAAVEQTARRLLAKPQLAAAIDRWSIPESGLVMAVGDSITTYRYSYAHILDAMLSIHRSQNAIRFVNVAQSGYTSNHGLEATYIQNLALQPDWVFIKFGVNDSKQFGGADARTLVSLEEYRANIAAIIDAFQRFTSAHIVLLTPTPVVETITSVHPDYAAMRLSWNNKILENFAAVVGDLARQHSLPLVNLIETFSLNPDPSYFLPDGLHPSPEGHRRIVEKLLNSLDDVAQSET